ncbi:MAG: uracil-DNA glycosylase [Neisseria sp.]|nr:uracil-DNA glycosylase [Neisseria sp.]
MTVLAEELAQRFGCDLAPSSGSMEHGIVLVADVPGEQEMLGGKPFSGASGRYLESLLQSIGLSREAVYLTHVVKFRPPEREPNREEIAAFYPLLLEELHALRPKIVVTLGRVSLNAFLPKLKISQVHAQPFTVNDGDLRFTLLPLFHPAAAFHNGKVRPMLQQGFTVLGELLQAA